MALKFFLALFFVEFFLIPLNAEASGRCVRYDIVGDTHCRNAEKKAEKLVVEPTTTVVVTSPQEKKVLTEEELLEKKVDEYIENYGKPPREYIRFNLNPTLENALIWAQKFEETNRRTEEISDAWGQAQNILKQRREMGLDLPEYDTEKPVKDFMKPQTQEDAVWLPPKEVSQKPPALGFSSPADIFVRQDDSAIRVGTDVPVNGSISYVQDGVPQGPIQISYYFSKDCQYCARFEPEFQALIKELGSKVDVTCVDVSPSSRTEMNVFGKVDCRWRSVGSGEMALFGIQSTPTLMINKPGVVKLKKIEGLTDMKRLKAYLLSKED